MKKISLILLLLTFSTISNSAFDKERYCRGRTKIETRYAEWGKELQQDMLQNCRLKDVNICLELYVEKIKDSEAKDMKNFRDSINSNQDSNEVARLLTITDIGEAHVAAIISLKTLKSVDRIVNEKYIECLSVK